LTMSMLTKDIPSSTRSETTKPVVYGSTFDKLQKDLVSLQSKINGLQKKIKPKKKNVPRDESSESRTIQHESHYDLELSNSRGKYLIISI